MPVTAVVLSYVAVNRKVLVFLYRSIFVTVSPVSRYAKVLWLANKGIIIVFIY